MSDVKDEIRRIALTNAIEHAGKANEGAVLGKLMAGNPELRQQARELHETINEIVDEINLMSADEQNKEIEKFGGYKKVEKKSEEKRLPALPDAGQGKVVTRFSPNPDGALHIGNARPMLLSWAYAQMYEGKFILRFDDTDPKVKIPEKRFYDWIKEELAWFGIKPNEITIASDRLNVYYRFAEQLLRTGKAYIDTCNPEAWKKMRNECKACPCRDLPVEKQIEKWNMMLLHKFKEGRAVYRVKTDISHGNPAIRDWAGLRIVDKPKHPLNKKSVVWPLFNFASAIDDHEFGVTHILRGQEHSTNETKQRFLYDHMGWTYPKVIILGRFSMAGMVMSKSLIRKGIADGKFSGWDDPRLGTLRSLRRRGFQAEALQNLIMDVGPTSNDSTIAAENLSAYNRKVIDKIADRYFFVAEPVKIKIKNPPVKAAKLKLHPEKLEARNIKVGTDLFIEKHDLKLLRGKEVRLIGLYNVLFGKTCDVTSIENKDVAKIHWLPVGNTIKVKLIMPGKTINGIGEKGILKEKSGSIVQFERVGFARIESKTKTSVTAIFGHN